jgi:hypothetical protein
MQRHSERVPAASLLVIVLVLETGKATDRDVVELIAIAKQ